VIWHLNVNLTPCELCTSAAMRGPPLLPSTTADELNAQLLERRRAAAALTQQLRDARRATRALLDAMPANEAMSSNNAVVGLGHSVHRLLGTQCHTDSSDSTAADHSLVVFKMVSEQAQGLDLPLLIMLVSRNVLTGQYRLKASELCSLCGYNEDDIHDLESPAPLEVVIDRFRKVQSDVLDLVNRRTLEKYLSLDDDVKADSVELSSDGLHVQFQLPRVDEPPGTTKFIGISLEVGTGSANTSVEIIDPHSDMPDKIKSVLADFERSLKETVCVEPPEALAKLFRDWQWLKDYYEGFQMMEEGDRAGHGFFS